MNRCEVCTHMKSCHYKHIINTYFTLLHSSLTAAIIIFSHLIEWVAQVLQLHELIHSSSRAGLSHSHSSQQLLSKQHSFWRQLHLLPIVTRWAKTRHMHTAFYVMGQHIGHSCKQEGYLPPQQSATNPVIGPPNNAPSNAKDREWFVERLIATDWQNGFHRYSFTV